MNTLERISYVTIVILTCSIIYIFYSHKNTIALQKPVNNKVIQQAFDSSALKASEHLKSARLYKEKDDLIKSIEYYHKAAKLYDGYMDASSKDFLGEELKEAIKLSIVRLNMKFRENPGDKDILYRLKTVHKMERNFGHGCE